MTENLRPALFHLTGALRGGSRTLDGPVLLGTAPEADMRFPAEDAPQVQPRHLEVYRDDDGWRLRAADEAAVFVNGEPVGSDRLLPGDTLQLGEDGPLLRFRLEPEGSTGYKSLRDALADCVACARFGADSAPARIGLLLKSMPRELFTQTSPVVRGAMLAGVTLGLALSGYQAMQSRSLGNRLEQTRGRLEAVASSLRAEQERRALDPAMIDSVRALMRTAGSFSGADRPEFLGEASRSVALVEGAYSFEDPGSGRTLSQRRAPDRSRGVRAEPRLAPDAEGPPLVRRFTGTAFVVTRRGHFITNRHLLHPWEQDRVAESLSKSGYRPVLRRLVAYLPGRRDPAELEIVMESDSVDLALLRAESAGDLPPPLPLADEPAAVGEEVFLLGYPTGIRALLARSDARFVASLRRDSVGRDLHQILDRLAAEGVISALATRGIVGQLGPSAIVYDAETSQGGSGGPVLGRGGRVVAVNKGLVPEFGGSNLGVPVRYVRRLLERAGVRR